MFSYFIFYLFFMKPSILGGFLLFEPVNPELLPAFYCFIGVYTTKKSPFYCFIGFLQAFYSINYPFYQLYTRQSTTFLYPVLDYTQYWAG